MQAHGLKKNPKKCAFGVTAGNFLGFLVHQRGIEIDKNKATAIMAAPPPRTKKELQSFLDTERFVWGAEHQAALDNVKQYLSQPSVLMPPKRGKPLRLYISALEGSIGCLLAQNNKSEREQIISKTDLIKYMLTRPIIHGRIGKWTMALSEFTFQYVAQKSVKGQVLADFLAHHPAQGQEEELELEIGMARMEKNY
ncbi:unnamed protein product [Prunus armeniaca]